jgi:phospholipid transport system substrate-binding protein
MMRRFLSVGAAAIAVGLLTAVPRSDAAVDPGAFVGDLGTQGIQMLGPNVPLAQRTARFTQLFQNDFDIPGISRFVLGRYWRAYTPEQQQEFLRLFQASTVLEYSKKLGEYGGGAFRVIGVQSAGDETVVNSQVVRPNGKPVQMDWHLIPGGGEYKVSDVFVDGVSMKITERDEYASVIEKNGGQPEALLAVLRQELQPPGPGR